MPEFLMPVLAVLLLLLGAIGSWRVARRAARADRLFTALAASSLAVILLWFLLAHGSGLGFAFLTWDDWTWFERPVLFLALFLLLALCLVRLPRRERVLVGAVAAIFGLYALAETAAPLGFGLWAGRLSDRTDRADDGQQSTGWSCGAAALAWALRQEGVPASERQVAWLAGTNPLHGTTDRGLVRAADVLGRPLRVSTRKRWETLAAARLPALAGWYLGGGVAHMVVVTAVEPGGQVRVHDPLQGDQTYSQSEFMAHWMGDLLAGRP